jgi:bifunctional UDP-N-acetylglucosamine pyrophosphorylase / glucosamine-1-phosphate N-acetyltransferase
MVHLLAAAGEHVTVVETQGDEVLGANTRAELAQVEAAFQTRARAAALEAGATLMAPDTVFFGRDVTLAPDVVIEPNVVLAGHVTIASGARIRSFSYLEGCHIGQGATVGPFARIRPHSRLEEGAHVGNFVEIKNSHLAAGAKANHLSYIGDSDVGPKANIGAGTITCNYDGVHKHKTTIGAGAFIGSNTALVAPVSVGAGATVGAGSTITQNVPDGALALARARQVNKLPQ